MVLVLVLRYSIEKRSNVLLAMVVFNTEPQNPTSDAEAIDKDMIWAQLLSCRSAGYVCKGFVLFS